MEFGEFEYSLASSAVVVGLICVLLAKSVSPLFAVALLALCLAGFFALMALRKAGVQSPRSEYLYAGAVAACFAASALSFLSLAAALQMLFIPLAMIAPALGLLARDFVRSG